MYAELLSHYFANMSAKQVYIFPTELRPILRVFYQLRNSKKLEILPKPFSVQHVRKLYCIEVAQRFGLALENGNVVDRVTCHIYN